MATIGHTKAAPVAWTRAVRAALIGAGVIVAVFGLGASLLSVSAILGGDFSAIGADLNAYLGYTRTWLDTGEWYAPAQVAGPYVVEQITGNVYPPTLLYLTVPFALGLPMILWYAIPAVVAGLALWKLRPSRRALLLLAVFLACNPRWWTVLLLGNPALWVFAFILAGCAWGWPAILVAVKLTFAPLALIGIRDRRWWLLAVVALVACIPFGHLWVEFATVLANTRSERGLPYVLGEWPIALGILAVGLVSGSGHEAIRGRLRSAAHRATLAAGRG